MMAKKQYEAARQLLESSMKVKNIDHADVYYLCGEINRRLGNTIIAE